MIEALPHPARLCVFRPIDRLKRSVFVTLPVISEGNEGMSRIKTKNKVGK